MMFEFRGDVERLFGEGHPNTQSGSPEITARVTHEYSEGVTIP